MKVGAWCLNVYIVVVGKVVDGSVITSDGRLILLTHIHGFVTGIFLQTFSLRSANFVACDTPTFELM